MKPARDLWGLKRDQWWIYAIIATVLLASVVVPKTLIERAPVICPLRATTSVECPGCGLTRSFVATADGRLADAFGHHPLGTALFVVLAAVVTARIASVRCRRPLFPDGPLAAWPIRGVVFAWLGWAVLRNLA